MPGRNDRVSLPARPVRLAPGELLGPYRIVRQLGAGGMGTVYEAVDTTLDRRVALKVIANALAGDPGFRARFVQEAQAQASLDSPHVVQVFAHGQVSGRLYIASQLIPDGDLGAMLRRHGPTPPALAVDLIAQVADGLAEAHRVGLVHRDIKPANVLLRNRGTDTVAYLADFGIARQVGAGPSASGGAVDGTPGYLAPELHRGRPAGPASDVYSLGCLLWAALTGRAPYERASDGQVVEAHRGAAVPQLSGRTPLEREVNRVLRTALATEPRERHPSAAALRDDLRSCAGTTPAGRRGSAGVVTRTGAGIAALVAVIVLAVALAGRGGDDPATGATGATSGLLPADGPATSRERTAITNIARVLEAAGDLDQRGADCTARRLVDDHGVHGLQDRGLLDQDLMLVQDGRGRVEQGVLADIFTTAFACLWDAAPLR